LTASAAPRFRLEVFEGPLDLLLHLIRRNEIDIYDIPIAEIAGQYLATLSEWQSLDLAIAGEYLVMASTLMEIKSRMLLPQAPPADGEEEEDPRAELVQKLLEYESFRGAVESMRTWEEERSLLFFRTSFENPDDYLLPLPEGALSSAALLRALERLLEKAGVVAERVTSVTPRRRVSLRMKMAEILRRLRQCPDGLEFDSLFTLPCAREEIVLAFLALLELIRLGQAAAVQKRPDATIRIHGIPATAH
jgi:segregation and condensation protein A